MGCQHIVRRCRCNSSSSCRRSCRDNPVNHNRNMIDGTAQKSTCHRRQIESAYLLQYLHAIHGIRVMQSDSTPDCLRFPFQSSRIQTRPSSSDKFWILLQQNRCDRTAGRRIADPHFTHCRQAVPLLLQHTHCIDSRQNGCQHLLARHRCCFCKIGSSTADFPFR